jgi:VanZ family protein
LFEFLEKRKVWLVYVPLVVYWLTLFFATSLPVQKLPSVGISDKFAHFTAFFCLSVLLNLTLIFQRKSQLLFNKAFLATIIICLVYAAVDELHQMLIPGRSAEVLDWVADGLGTIAGILTLYFLIYKLKYHLKFE